MALNSTDSNNRLKNWASFEIAKGKSSTSKKWDQKLGSDENKSIEVIVDPSLLIMSLLSNVRTKIRTKRFGYTFIVRTAKEWILLAESVFLVSYNQVFKTRQSRGNPS